MTLKETVINRGQSTTVWMSVITMFLAVCAMPELGKILPPEVLPYLVIAISVATGIKRVMDVGMGSMTPYMMGLQCLLATLSLPSWGQILPPSSLPYLVSVVSAITWYKRLFFPTSLEPDPSNLNKDPVSANIPVDVVIPQVTTNKYDGRIEP